MFVLIKRKLEGPSIPELGQPTSVTFDSVTLPVVRPSTGPAALASYELQRSLDGTTWSAIATGPSIFGNPAAQYVDGGRAALTTYYYRARATDVAGRVSDYCAPVSGTTVGNAMPAVMNTRFDEKNMSWVYVKEYGIVDNNGNPMPADSQRGNEFRLSGTDLATGQAFGVAGPSIWGQPTTTPVLQQLSPKPSLLHPNDVFAHAITSDGAELTRKVDYAPVAQSAYRLFPAVPFDQQGMIYVRGKIKLPVGMSGGEGFFLSLVEVKYNWTDKKLQFDLHYDGRWYFRIAIGGGGDAGGAGGVSYLWGTGSTPNRTSTPMQDSFFTSPQGDLSAFFKLGAFADDPAGAPPDFTRWHTYECAFRLQSPSGVVAGGASSGWAWAATAVGTPSEPPANRSAKQRLYVRGSNMFQEPAPGATIIFPFLHYSNMSLTNLPIKWRQVEVYDYWPSDASTHPADAI